MPTISEVDRRVEQAKESFAARAEEIGRRYRGVRERIDRVRGKIDLKAHVASHPWVAVGIAFAAGALLGGLIGGKRVEPRPEVEPGTGAAIVGLLGALALSAARSFAVHEISGAAIDWFERTKRRDVAASHQPQTEAVLER